MPEEQMPTTIIAADAKLIGDLTFKNAATLLGQVEGTIAGDGELKIADSAIANAKINASTITVDGQVKGDIAATQRLQLNQNASVLGDINARSLSVAEGASFVGHCRVGDDAVTPQSLEPKLNHSTQTQESLDQTPEPIEARINGHAHTQTQFDSTDHG